MKTAAQEAEHTVVVIDDEEDVRAMLRYFLEEEGYRVIEARDGLEGLELLRSLPLPCFVLLDLVMPRMDGWEFRKRQLEEPRLANLPVFVSTSAVDRVPPGVPMIPKPVDPALLLREIRAACNP